MSGPKVSVYSLTGKAERIVNEQIRCEQEALLCASRIKGIFSFLDSADGRLDRSIAAIELLKAKFGVGNDRIEEIKKFRITLAERTRHLRQEYANNMPTVFSKYTISEAALEEKRRMLARIRKVKEQVQKLKSEAEKHIAAGKEIGEKELRQRQEIIVDYLSSDEPSHDHPTRTDTVQDSREIRQSISEKIAMTSSLDFDSDGVSESPDEISAEKAELKKQLLALLQEDLPEKIKTNVQSSLARLERITSQEHLRSFKAISVPSILEQIEKHRETARKQRIEFEKLLERYQVLCQMADIEPKTLSFSKEAIRLISEETQQMEKELVRQTEQSYIRDSVNEVMTEMGYDIIGYRDITKRNGKRFRHELYRFGEGTAVDVTLSPEGQISMELGGIARMDRLPDHDEMEVLTRGMESFCGEFAEFERRMKERGIIVGSRVAMMPPSPEHATIINVSDYTVTSGKTISEMDVKKKQRSSKKDVQRRND